MISLQFVVNEMYFPQFNFCIFGFLHGPDYFDGTSSYYVTLVLLDFDGIDSKGKSIQYATLFKLDPNAFVGAHLLIACLQRISNIRNSSSFDGLLKASFDVRYGLPNIEHKAGYGDASPVLILKVTGVFLIEIY